MLIALEPEDRESHRVTGRSSGTGHKSWSSRTAVHAHSHVARCGAHRQLDESRTPIGMACRR